MKVKINNLTVDLPEGSTLADLLEKQNISLAGIATAVNGNVVTAAKRAATILTDGDTVTVIKAFYGG